MRAGGATSQPIQRAELQALGSVLPAAEADVQALPDAPVKVQARSSWMGTLAKCVTVAAFGAVLATGFSGEARAQVPPPAVATQLGSGSFAIGAHLDSAQIAVLPSLRSPSEKDLAASLSGFRYTVTHGHTPYMQPFFEPGAGARVTRPSTAWNSANPVNTQYTIDTLPKDGFIHVSMPLWVSGHCPDRYDAALYPRITGQPMPEDEKERKMANAKLYTSADSPLHNVHWVWVRHVGTNQPDQVLVAGLPANGEPVRMVQLALKAKPGDHLQVRWSPFTGPDPKHPIVGPDDFTAGRTFDIIVPANVTVER